jgi:flavin-dependent dehydrogenase
MHLPHNAQPNPAGSGQSQWDVVIAGAGPAGSLAAALLARTGARTLLVDKATFPRGKVCGCCLNGSGLRVLAAAGFPLEVLRREAIPISDALVRAGRAEASFAIDTGLIVSREVLDATLARYAVECGAHFLDGTVLRTRGGVAEGLVVELRRGGEAVGVSTRLLIDASGLAGRVQEDAPETSVAPASRIGAGACLPEAPRTLPAGRIRLHVGEGGYVGMVRLPDGRLDIAAALSPELVRRCGGLSQAVEKLLRQAGSEIPAGLHDAEWRGTPPLSATRTSAAAHRLFRIGDAASFLEPFTGEGMAWALGSAWEVAPFAVRAVRHWDDRLIRSWNDHHGALQSRRQRACGTLAAILRRPALVRVLLASSRLFSPVYTALIRSLNDRPPSQPRVSPS